MANVSLREMKERLPAAPRSDRWTALHEWLSVPSARGMRFAFFATLMMASFVLIGVLAESQGIHGQEVAMVALLLGATALLGVTVEARRRAYYHPPALRQLRADVRQERAERVSFLLDEKAMAGRFEDIQRTLRWTSAATVAGLEEAVARGTVVEDFDMQAAHYVYVSTHLAPTSFDAHDAFLDRLRAGRSEGFDSYASRPHTSATAPAQRYVSETDKAEYDA